MGYLQDFIQNARGAMGDRQFRSDVAQGTTDALNRGVIASAIGAPVDLANTLSNLLKAGVGYVGHKTGLMRPDQMPTLTENHVMGSEWVGEKMRQAGMVSDKRNHLAELLAGGVLAPASSVYGAQKAPQIAAGILKAQANAAAPRTLNPQAGAIVWHGSPHKFDKFDSSKIGTGEGAQAYGHGMYFAETPDVAMTYQPRDPKLEAKIMQRYSSAERLQQYPAMQVFEDFLLHKTPTEVAANIEAAGYSPSDLRIAQQALKTATNEYHAQRAGALYKVDLPDSAIARMLDWDKPLSQQAPEVLNAFNDPKMAGSLTADIISGKAKKPAYQGVDAVLDLKDALGVRGNGPSTPEVSQWLRAKGIPGIRYLDGGSRGEGQGTSNYVVFPGEEGLLQILERNGAPIR